MSRAFTLIRDAVKPNRLMAAFQIQLPKLIYQLGLFPRAQFDVHWTTSFFIVPIIFQLIIFINQLIDVCVNQMVDILTETLYSVKKRGCIF